MKNEGTEFTYERCKFEIHWYNQNAWSCMNNDPKANISICGIGCPCYQPVKYSVITTVTPEEEN